MRFESLYFGAADAKTESSRERDKFISSFVDKDGIVDKISRGEICFVSGPKGCGKTAIGQYMRLTDQQSSRITRVHDMSSLPLLHVPKIKTDTHARSISSSESAWQFVLISQVIQTLLQDDQSDLRSQPGAAEAIKWLGENGFLNDLSRAVHTSSETTLKIPDFTGGQFFSYTAKKSMHLGNAIEPLVHMVSRSRGGVSRYICILDGLDSIEMISEEYVTTISTLVQACYRLNENLQDLGAPVSVVCLIRTDMFARLNLSDSGKLLDDWTHILDWRVLSDSPMDSPLFELVNKKAYSPARRAEGDVIHDFFPREVQVGQGARIEIHRYLLSLTRHTPRDILQLLKAVQSEENGRHSLSYRPRISNEVIREGVVKYSDTQFSIAISNELVGRTISRDGYEIERTVVLSALRNMARSHFSREEYSIELGRLAGTGEINKHDIDQVLRWLFYAGAIGLKRDKEYVRFYHRRSDVEMDTRGPFVLHNALVHAFNTPR